MSQIDITHGSASLTSLLRDLTETVKRGVIPEEKLIEAINYRYDKSMKATRERVAREILNEMKKQPNA